MSKHYPLNFILEDGVHVEVNKAGNYSYDFILTKKEGGERRFTFIDDDKTKDQKVESLDFAQLNAVRRFWLEKDDSV
jgi:hypothetical protein